MSEPAPDTSVRQELERLRDLAATMTLEDLHSGAWLGKLLRVDLVGYAASTDAADLRARHPDLDTEELIDRAVGRAKRRAMLAAGLSAGAYSAAVVATLGSAGTSAPVTVPAAVASFAADLFLTSRIQARLAHDLAELHGHDVDLDDAEELSELVRVAYGVKASHSFEQAVARLAPQATKRAVERGLAASATWLHALPVVGRHLLQRQLVKVAIPVVTVPLAMAINYWGVAAVERAAEAVYAPRGAVRRTAWAAADHAEVAPELALELVYLCVRADGVVGPEESTFLRRLADELETEERGRARGELDLSEGRILEDLADEEPEIRALLLEVACRAVAVDGEVHHHELDLLRRIAAVAGVALDEERARELARP